MLLAGKVALVTGAAAGIGEAIARLFGAEGARLFLLDRDAAANEAVASSIPLARAIAADVRDAAAVAELGRLDILVNNAGIFPRAPFLEITEAQWDEMFDVNLKSMFRTVRAAAPHMLAQGSGKIVNISSVTFHLGTPNLSHYVASKGAVIGLTRSLAREFGGRNVHVNCITPGAIQTESEKQFVSEEEAARMVEQQSLKRRILPLDVARAALFLASRLSDGLTGQTLNVDGGWFMH